MSEALRDPVWQFVGVVISLAALLVAIAAIRFQLIRKSMVFHHSMDNPVFYVLNEELRERLRITFDDREVKRLSSFDLHFFNDGNAPIAPADFIQPVFVEFPQGVHIFGVLTTETTPPNLGVEVTRQDLRFTVKPLLLNPGDTFTLQFLMEPPTDFEPVTPTVQGRITGVKTFVRKPFRHGTRHRVGYYAFRSSIVVVPTVVALLTGLFGNWVYGLLRPLLTTLLSGG